MKKDLVSTIQYNRNLEKEVKKGVEMLRVDMSKTPFYQLGEERGEKRGRKIATKNTSLHNAYIMITKFGMKIDIIGKEFNLSRNEILEYIESKK